MSKGIILDHDFGQYESSNDYLVWLILFLCMADFVVLFASVTGCSEGTIPTTASVWSPAIFLTTTSDESWTPYTKCNIFIAQFVLHDMKYMYIFISKIRSETK